MNSIQANSPRVVIIGAGFGGLSAAKQLPQAPFDVTIVDRHNYHLFQPLLYQVAPAGLSPGDIASPIRGILRRQKNNRVVLAKVSGIDTLRREVVAEGRRIPYDYLVVAGISGSRIEDVLPAVPTAPALAGSAGDSGSVFEALQHNVLTWQEGARHV